MVNHVTEEQRSPAGWIRGQMGTKLREAVLSCAEQHWILAGSFGGSSERRIPPFAAVPIDAGALWDNPGPPQNI
jgi:hypothetical protein